MAGPPVMFSVFFYGIFAIIIVGILFGIISSAAQWSRNNKQPVLTVEARITGKRTHTSHSDQMMNDNMVHSSTTTYYVTFQVESGDRMELKISGDEYGLLAEDDLGRLTFQGTRYLGFERI
jgi:hypothetical protein